MVDNYRCLSKRIDAVNKEMWFWQDAPGTSHGRLTLMQPSKTLSLHQSPLVLSWQWLVQMVAFASSHQLRPQISTIGKWRSIRLKSLQLGATVSPGTQLSMRSLWSFVAIKNRVDNNKCLDLIRGMMKWMPLIPNYSSTDSKARLTFSSSCSTVPKVNSRTTLGL